MTDFRFPTRLTGALRGSLSGFLLTEVSLWPEIRDQISDDRETPEFYSIECVDHSKEKSLASVSDGLH